MKDIYVNFFYNCLFYMLPSILLNSILCNRVFQFYLGGFLIGLGKAKSTENSVPFLVGEGGFEPPKPVATDLQSAPFDRSGIPPYLYKRK